MTHHPDPQTTPARAAYVPSLIAIGLVVSVISALGAPLIPEIAAHYRATLGATQWSLTATMLVGAVLSPLIGRLGDGPHRRAVLIGALAVVTAGGALAAVAPALWVLVAGRAMQGVGLALMPLTMASARENLPAERATGVIGTLSVVAAVGIGLGYPATGFIAEYLGTAAAFWAGAAASGAALALAVLFVPASHHAGRAPRLDVAGAALIGAGVLCLLLAFEKGADWGWGAGRTRGLLVVAVVALAAWVVSELRVAAPLVDLRLMRHPAVLTANVTGLVLGLAMYLGISLITQLVQLPQGMGATPFVAGLCLIPLSITSAGANRLMPLARTALTPRGVLPAGCTLIAVGLAFFAATGDAVWQAMVTMGLVGLGIGFTFAAMPALIVGAVPAHETSSAMSFYQVSRYVGFSLGAGLAVTLLRAFSGGDESPSSAAYGHASAAGAVLCLVAAAVAWALPGLGRRASRRAAVRAPSPRAS